MSSLKITAALLTFTTVMPAHGIYITIPASLPVVAAPHARMSKASADRMVQSFFEASVDVPALYSIAASEPMQAAALPIPNAASNLIFSSKYLPAKDGFVQYVPEPYSMVVITFAGLLPLFRRRRQ